MEAIEFALGQGGVIPGGVDAQPRHDRTLGGEPLTPLAQIFAQVVIGGDATAGCDGKKVVLATRIHLGADVEGQEGLGYSPIVAQDIHRRLQARARPLNEGLGATGEDIGFLGGHPGAAG